MKMHLNKQIPNIKSWACVFGSEQHIKTNQPKANVGCSHSPVEKFFVSWATLSPSPYSLLIIPVDVTCLQGKQKNSNQNKQKQLHLILLGKIFSFSFFCFVLPLLSVPSFKGRKLCGEVEWVKEESSVVRWNEERHWS